MSNPAESHQVVLITGELPSIYAQYQRVQNYIVSELSAYNEQWINPDFDNPNL